MGAAGSIENVQKVGEGDRNMKDISNMEKAKAEVIRLRALLAEQAEIIASDSILMDELRTALAKELDAEKEALKEAAGAAAVVSADASKVAGDKTGTKSKGKAKKAKAKAKKKTKAKKKSDKAESAAKEEASAEPAEDADVFAAKAADASDVTNFIQAKKEVVALRRVARLAYATLRSHVSTVLLTELPQALAKAREAGLTPLVVDATKNKGVDSFYKYQCAQIIDAKGMAGRFFQKVATLEELQEELRSSLVMALQNGQTLYIAMRNGATDLKKQYCKRGVFPIELFTPGSIVEDKFLCAQSNDGEGILTPSEADDRMIMANINSRKGDFNVIICTHFSEEDYVEFLQDMLPLESCQAIVVVEPDQFKERIAAAVKEVVQPKAAAAAVAVTE